MLFKLSLKMFLIGLLVLSSLWVCIIFFPVLYSILSPPRDIQDVLHALEMRGSAPPDAAVAVQQATAVAGPLRKAWQVGYYSGATGTLQLNASHISKRIQVSYLAWFQNLPKPIVLLISRSEADGGRQSYRINEGTPMSLVIGYSRPLVMFAFSLYLVRRNRNATQPVDEISGSKL
jgi:hypothetical protein